MSALVRPDTAPSFRRHCRKPNTPNPNRLCGLALLIAIPHSGGQPAPPGLSGHSSGCPDPIFALRWTTSHEPAEWGQTVWLGFIRRELISSAELQELVDQGLRGATSNPSVPEQAIAGSADYDRALRALVATDRSVDEIHESRA